MSYGFRFIRFSKFKVTSAGTCQVSSVDSEQEEQPFSNLIGANSYAPSLPWCSSFTNASAHDVSLTCPSGTVSGLYISGANFRQVNISGYKYLNLDSETGLYSGLIAIGDATPVNFTIPAQESSDGYFRIKSIILTEAPETDFVNTVYPYRRQHIHNANISVNPAQRSFKTKTGESFRTFEVSGQKVSRTEMEAISEMKQEQTVLNPMILEEYFLGVSANVSRAYLVRRLPDTRYRERAHHDYEYILQFEEIV